MYGYHLYEHRQDESVLIVALVTEDGFYECHRYGETATFTIERETFLSIYKKLESAKP